MLGITMDSKDIEFGDRDRDEDLDDSDYDLDLVDSVDSVDLAGWTQHQKLAYLIRLDRKVWLYKDKGAPLLYP